MSEKQSIEQRVARVERAVHKLQLYAARTEHCLTTGCFRCSGQCDLEDHVWQSDLGGELITPPDDGAE
ncbi:MAG: hypothetical protein BroJett014_11280 [Planctomycetota bacterium]|nr:hypothetical protein [Planctomycetota bacterium]GIK52155.1 MAG: hypothetical protein BroJett014_11280 [Planctomycetota bacterium]